MMNSTPGWTTLGRRRRRGRDRGGGQKEKAGQTSRGWWWWWSSHDLREEEGRRPSEMMDLTGCLWAEGEQKRQRVMGVGSQSDYNGLWGRWKDEGMEERKREGLQVERRGNQREWLKQKKMNGRLGKHSPRPLWLWREHVGRKDRKKWKERWEVACGGRDKNFSSSQ